MRTHSIQSAQQMLVESLGAVRIFLEDPSIIEVMINGPNNVWVERVGEPPEQVAVVVSENQIETAITLLAKLDSKDARGNTVDGLINARLDNYRVAAVLAPTSLNGASMCIRKHNPVLLSLDDYVKAKGITDEQRQFLQSIVRNHANILVAGGTSSGKTTFTNALLQEVPNHERIMSIEDVPELKVLCPNWVPLQANEQVGITIRELVRMAMRYRPDRIIIGEVRGGEAYDLLDSANSGHSGTIATIHANSAYDALSRLETLVLRGGVEWPHRAICSQIARAFDYVLFMRRKDGIRQLAQIIRLNRYNVDSGDYTVDTVFDADA